MSQLLVLDIGNSRMKWGLHGPRGWLQLGITPNGEIGTLTLREWQNLPRPARVIGVNVAGEAARVRVEAQVARWRLHPEWLYASAFAGGVRNGYAVPAQLGPDRWASLVAARQRVLGWGAAPQPVVVVNSGTAVTIDALDAGGSFIGGLILPGVAIMLQALTNNTSGLKVPPGRIVDFPTSTADAIASGAVHAVVGAIAQMRMRLQAGGAPVACLVAGGAAALIAPHLTAPVEVVDNLVLEGVLALAGD